MASSQRPSLPMALAGGERLPDVEASWPSPLLPLVRERGSNEGTTAHSGTHLPSRRIRTPGNSQCCVQTQDTPQDAFDHWWLRGSSGTEHQKSFLFTCLGASLQGHIGKMGPVARGPSLWATAQHCSGVRLTDGCARDFQVGTLSALAGVARGWSWIRPMS